MADSLTTKNITTVEELTELDGSEKIFLNHNGTVKQISSENAKFGGGSGGGVEVIELIYGYLIESGSYYLAKLENGVRGAYPTPQEIYNWFRSGSIIILVNNDSPGRHYVTGISDYGSSDASTPATDITSIAIYSTGLMSGKFTYTGA